jgi:hypothetical protein
MARLICILAVTLFVSVGCDNDSPSVGPTRDAQFKGFLDFVPESTTCVSGCVPGVFCPARLRCPPQNMPRATGPGDASSPVVAP